MASDDVEMEIPRFPAPGGVGHSESSGVDDPPGDEAPSPAPVITETVSVVAADGSSGIKPASEIEPTPEAATPDIMSSRAYQLEMLDQSLQRNVIVAMDTGSGKTQVAVLRIKAELEKCPADKMVWFLAPTISLCEQQCEVIRLQNSAAPIKVLTGNQGLDSWSRDTWDTILDGTRIVVSTFQVLLDALTHAFVNMDMLALLVIDEAHNCVRNSPGCSIMNKFYHPRKDSKISVPAILGLTASPIMRSNLEGIKVLESTLDAICITPTLHRDELLRCVNKPELSYSEYESVEYPEHTAIMKSLRLVHKSIDIKTDPQMLRLLADGSERGRREFRQAILKYDTYTQNQMKGFWGRAKEILRELGPWAVDHYISKAIGDFEERIESAQAGQGGLENENKTYLARFLHKVARNSALIPPAESSGLSEKVRLLIKVLLSAGDNVVGILFVKERATVTIITDLLATFPDIRKKYRIETMVGTSNFHTRTKNVYDFKNDVGLSALQDFRSGKINLLVATSVLEEGIDIPACNLVVCFDKPANLKSFIQRRGRARMKESKLVLLLERSAKGPPEWEALEDEMKKQYQEDKEEQRRIEELEKEESTGSISFVVESTGARLDLDSAKQHLEHFCRVLSQGEFIDCRPDYIIHRVSHEDDSPVTAKVLLPSFLPPELRQAQSSRAWMSQKNATKEAAFHAYIALYKAGLINENLLPIKDGPPEERISPQTHAPPLNPWKEIAQVWQGTEAKTKWVLPLSFHDESGNCLGQYHITLPVQIDQPRPIKIYPEWGVEWGLSFGPGRMCSDDEAAALPDHTSDLLALHFAHRWEVEDRPHVLKFSSNDKHLLKKDQARSVPFDPQIHEIQMPYLVRDKSKCPFEYTGIIPSKPPIEEVQNPFYEYEAAPKDGPYLTLKKTTRRADFLHRMHSDPRKQLTSSKPYTWVLPMSWATVDTIPKRFAQFSMLIPSVIHELEVLIIATQLSESILKPIGLTNPQRVLEAISSRAASEPVDYERLEFLGDSILKFCVVVQASAKRQKWRPIYVDDNLEQDSLVPQRILPSKTLADVVEALIGASYQDGGIPKALKCISVFLAEDADGKIDWFDEKEGRAILFNHATSDVELPPSLELLEELIGYTFQKKSLLIEAMTHGSYAADTHWRSFERLEFLGDAILDYIIVTKVFNVQPALPHSHLHMIKTAMVNGDFLAFVGLQHGLKKKETVTQDDASIGTRDVTYPLWKFMRHAMPAIGIEQAAMSKRFEALGPPIVEALEKGTHYPWASLARLRARKFYSDLFEALLGAVWVDSGSMEACEAMLHKFAVLPYLDRIIRDKVHVQHPKEELGRLAINEKVHYMYDVIEGSDGEREYRCTVQVGGLVVAKVESGVNKEEVMTKAAEQAVRFLTEAKTMVD
ncbi:Dicer-like protein 2 [Ilyonectria robusta]